MNKYKKLFGNSLIFTVASFGSKILSFLFVRFYTELLSVEEYGIIDVFTTTSGLLYPFLTLSIVEAVLRFSIDDEENRKKTFSLGFFTVLGGNLLLLFALPLFGLSEIFREHAIMLFFISFTSAMNVIFSHFSRGLGKTKIFALGGLIHTGAQIGLNVLFLAGLSMGVQGYFLAQILANLISAAFLLIAGGLHRYFSLSFDGGYYKKMLRYSVPLVPNSVFWWIMQASDRYALIYFLGNGVNGLYAVSGKIPTIIDTFSSIFFQAWQLSSVEEANSEDKAAFYTNVFRFVTSALILLASFIVLLIRPLFQVLVADAYYSAWRCAPMLILASVFSSCSGFVGVNYVAMKKTVGVFWTTLAGAVTNISLNLLLIPRFGMIGAAFATFVSFFVTFVCRAFHTAKFVKIRYGVRTFVIPALILFIQCMALSVGFDTIYLQGVALISLCLIYFEEITLLIRRVLRFGKNRIVRKK
ncbi:MAG: polysaccharide biosynthesis C-terminal domain-containing protein [Clostridia bacterium]|nr:polysaccharide biosynthesis C-terminal domain-containing protein [Clostridia bacterium]